MIDGLTILACFVTISSIYLTIVDYFVIYTCKPYTFNLVNMDDADSGIQCEYVAIINGEHFKWQKQVRKGFIAQYKILYVSKIKTIHTTSSIYIHAVVYVLTVIAAALLVVVSTTRYFNF